MEIRNIEEGSVILLENGKIGVVDDNKTEYHRTFLNNDEVRVDIVFYVTLTNNYITRYYDKDVVKVLSPTEIVRWRLGNK